MSKPIYLTKEYIDNMVEEFRKNVADAKMSDGEIKFTKKFNYTGDDDTKAHVVFRPNAYVKMLVLLKHFDSEVAWHGTVERRGKDTFIITDIVVYPQTVTGSTVNTDQEEYQKWLMALDDDYFNSMRMQGHSHVNMGTSPSGVDTNHQQQILSQLKDTDYYIFMVYNKRAEHTIKIYDYPNNVMYEDKDIVVSVADDGFDAEEFLVASDKVVTRTTYTGGYGGGYHLYGADGDKTVKQSAKKEQSKGKEKAEEKPKGKKGSTAKDAGKARDVLPYPEYGGYGGNYGSHCVATDWDREIFGRRYE